MAFNGYASYGGAEIINSRRAWVLAKSAGLGWLVGESYPGLDDAILGADYNDVTTAPWYDEDQADVSSRFYGVYGLKIDGLYDSTRSAAVTQNSGDGGVIGASRKGTKAVTVTATILARGRDAMEYGRAWLAAALELAGCAQTADCERADVLFFAEVPTSTTEANALSRLLKFSTVTSGPFAVNEYASRGVFNTDVEWTWTSEKPYIYAISRGVDMTLAPALALVQDSPINWVPFPSAELEEDDSGYDPPVIATNQDTAPSAITGDTGWAATVATVSGSSASSYLESFVASPTAPAAGTTSYLARIAGNGSTAVSTSVAALTITKTIAVSGTTGRLMQFALWAYAYVLAGSASAFTALTVTAQFQNSSSADVGSAIPMTLDASGAGVYTSARVALPATATKVILTLTTDITWGSGTTDDANSDVRVSVDATTAAYFGDV